jgi:hypothetical protein
MDYCALEHLSPQGTIQLAPLGWIQAEKAKIMK